MRLLKKINNNYALALDSKGEKIIVEGKGIGFQKMPCDLENLSLITRTYYDIKDQDVYLIQNISEEILEVSSKIFEFANLHLYTKLNPNLTLILADHIQFSIERYQNKMDLKMPIYYDIELLYPKESLVADYALRLIRTDLKINLPDSEKTGIALNIINSRIESKEERRADYKLIQLCGDIVTKKMNIVIDKKSFNYSRFVTHLEYLLKGAKEDTYVSSENERLYEIVKHDYPKISECVDEISAEFEHLNYRLNKEEKLYLMLHIN